MSNPTKARKRVRSRVPSGARHRVRNSDEVQTGRNASNTRKNSHKVHDTFECSLCLEDSLSHDQKFQFSSCNHFACKSCTATYLTLKITSKEFPIKCPVCSVADLTVNEISMILPPALVSKFHEFSLKKTLESDPEWRCCLHPGCENGVFWNESDGASPKWTCESCRQTFCLKCKDIGHNGTCESFLRWRKETGNVENKLAELIRDGTIKLCPTCSCPTQKKEGCNFLVCSQCQTPWCWHCANKHEDCHCGQNPHREWEQYGQFNFPQNGQQAHYFHQDLINQHLHQQFHQQFHQFHHQVHFQVHQQIHHQQQIFHQQMQQQLHQQLHEQQLQQLQQHNYQMQELHLHQQFHHHNQILNQNRIPMYQIREQHPRPQQPFQQFQHFRQQMEQFQQNFQPYQNQFPHQVQIPVQYQQPIFGIDDWF